MQVLEDIIFFEADGVPKDSPTTEIIGQKACGLLAIPKAWRPPFAVIKTAVYSEWVRGAPRKRKALIEKTANAVLQVASNWDQEWKKGIILRSSALKETLHDRGSYASVPLTADYGLQTVIEAIGTIFQQFANKAKKDDRLAIIIQPLVAQTYLGHSSNEKRVATEPNRWEFGFDNDSVPGRFDSRRSQPPDTKKRIAATNGTQFNKQLKSISRWCTNLDRGRIHLEWAWDKKYVWLLQMDFEDDSPDDGVNPKEFRREIDVTPAGKTPKDSIIKRASLTKNTGWGKVDVVQTFLKVRRGEFPKLFLVHGKNLQVALSRSASRKKLVNDLNAITHGRAVCRTACKKAGAKISSQETVNLPRTDSASPEEAVNFLEETLIQLQKKGTDPKDVCFIVHKFIPATASAWAFAYPDKQLVKIDSLWGVPDGLSFYPHDSFEVDAKLEVIISERPRYKPFFIQELKDGKWKRIAIKRTHARGRSLDRPDLIEIAKITHGIAKEKNEPVLVMWFCGIPQGIGIGKNLPWFMMKPDVKSDRSTAPKLPQLSIKNFEDIKKTKINTVQHAILLEPDVKLVRNNHFLDEVGKLATTQNWPIILQGSTLGHAYYRLKEAGAAVYPADVPKYTRTRNRQIFGKLVRDAIPSRIEESGERVIRAKIPKSEARNALLSKLFEEAFELQAAKLPNHVLEELADVLEVVRSLSDATGIDWKDVESVADKKCKERGSFKDGVVLVETSWHSIDDKDSATDDPRLISLRELAKIKQIPNGVELNYPCLIGRTEGITANLPTGRRLLITASANGLSIREISNDGTVGTEKTKQLELPLAQDET